MTEDELRNWASVFNGFPSETTVDIALAVLRLLDEKQAHMDASAALVIENAQLKVSLAAMTERVHAQSELLSRKAEATGLTEDEVNERHRKLAAMGLMDGAGLPPRKAEKAVGENAEASIQPDEIEAYQKKLHDEMGKMKFTSLVWGR